MGRLRVNNLLYPLDPMLTQLKQLARQVDGRYATPDELAFLKNYLDSVDTRLQAYEKIRDANEEIQKEVHDHIEAADTKFFKRGDLDISAICQRDREHGLRCISVSMLLNDIQRLRDDYLVWDQKIVRAFREVHPVEVTYGVLSQVMQSHLASEDYKLVSPFLQATQVALTV